MATNVDPKFWQALLPVIGSIAGGLLSRGGDQEVTQSQTWNVPEHIKPYLDEVMRNASDIWGFQANNNRSWPGPYVAPMTTEGIDAVAAMRGQALPNVVNQDKFFYQDAAQNNTLMDALGGLQGGMQNPWMGASNPYGGSTNPAFEQAIGATRKNVEDTFNRTTGAASDAAFARGGAYGGSAYNQFKNAQSAELANSLNLMESGMRNQQMNRAADLWGSDTGRNAGLAENVFGRQMQGLGAMTDMERTDLDTNKGLLGAGMISQGLDQQNLDAIMQAHYMNYDQPQFALDNMVRTISALSGPQTLTQTTSQPGNWMNGAMGGALMGNALAGYFGPQNTAQNYSYLGNYGGIPGGMADNYGYGGNWNFGGPG